jgi:hypothetical protein
LKGGNNERVFCKIGLVCICICIVGPGHSIGESQGVKAFDRLHLYILHF